MQIPPGIVFLAAADFLPLDDAGYLLFIEFLPVNSRGEEVFPICDSLPDSRIDPQRWLGDLDLPRNLRRGRFLLFFGYFPIRFKSSQEPHG